MQGLRRKQAPFYTDRSLRVGWGGSLGNALSRNKGDKVELCLGLPKWFLFGAPCSGTHARTHVALPVVLRAAVLQMPQACVLQNQRVRASMQYCRCVAKATLDQGWLLGNPTFVDSHLLSYWPQAAACEAFLHKEKNNRPTIPADERPRHLLHMDANTSGDRGRGVGLRTAGTRGGGHCTHLTATNAHATVVELEFMQGEAGRALEQGLEASHTVGPECVVAEVQLHQLGPGCDESLS